MELPRSVWYRRDLSWDDDSTTMTKTEIIFRFIDSCFPEATTAREIAESFTDTGWPMTATSVRCLLAQDYKRFCKIDKGLWAIRYEGNYPSTPYEVAESL